MSVPLLTSAELIAALVAIAGPVVLGWFVGLQIGVPVGGAWAGALAGVVLALVLFGGRLGQDPRDAAREQRRRG